MEQHIGVFPLQFPVSQLHRGRRHAGILENHRVRQHLLGESHQVVHAGVVVFVMPAVGVHKMAVFHAQFFCPGIHLLHEHFRSLPAVQILSTERPSAGHRRHLGRIIAAGQHHGAHQLLHRDHIACLQACHGRILLHQR